MMGQVSASLRRVEGGHSHWCPGCEQMHVIPDSWAFDGNLDAPTFSPSVLIRGKLTNTDPVTGKWDGWRKDAAGNTIDYRCHYILTAGVLNFCDDSSHALRGAVPLPPLPPGLTD